MWLWTAVDWLRIKNGRLILANWNNWFSYTWLVNYLQIVAHTMKQLRHQILNQTTGLDTVYSMTLDWNMHSSHQQMHIWHIVLHCSYMSQHHLCYLSGTPQQDLTLLICNRLQSNSYYISAFMQIVSTYRFLYFTFFILCVTIQLLYFKPTNAHSCVRVTII